MKFKKLKTAAACFVAFGAFSLVSGAFADAPAYNDITKVRCISSYSNEIITNRKLSDWEVDLNGMKAAGFNTVWIVDVWREFQPNAQINKYSSKAINNLKWICQEAKKRDMKVILGLGYVGVDYSPKGIDNEVWWLKPAEYGYYRSFIRRMAAETKDFDNVIYMISDELLLTTVMLNSPDKRQECVESFRAWAYATNPDINYWNKRWATNYTWNDLSPVSWDKRRTKESWVDHRSWSAYLLRTGLPGLVEAIRAEKPGAIVGFHDFILQPEWPEADSPLPVPNPFNFSSIPHYYIDGSNSDEDIDKNIKRLTDVMAYAKQRTPNLPLFIGEFGTNIKKCGEDGQKKFFEKSLAILKKENVGYSIWNWRYYVEGGDKIYFSMLNEKGIQRPALETVTSFNRQVGL